MKVSIIIPVYNAEKYIKKCIKSVIDQTYSNIEIIIINDGSIDSSCSIIEMMIKDDNRFVFINQKNKGISESRNIGVKSSSGDYLIFVDSDDWLDIDFIEKHIKSSTQCDLVMSSYYKEFSDSKEKRHLNISGKYNSSFIQRRMVGLLNNELSDPSQADSIVTVWSKLYKKNIILNHNIEFVSLKEIGTAEDLLFNLSYLEYANDVFVIDEPLYHYRRDNVNACTATYKKDLYRNWKYLFKRVYKFVVLKNEDFEKAYYNRIALSVIGLGLNEMSNSTGFSNRYNNIKLILNDNLYKKAYSKLSLLYVPIHWKVLFVFAKLRIVIGVYMILKIIKYILKKKK